MGPKVPKPQSAPPPPTIDAAKQRTDQADQLARRKGRAATFVSSEEGRGLGGVATKMLLGQGG